MRSDLRDRDAFDGLILCPLAAGGHCGTVGPPLQPFSDRDLALHVPTDTFDLMLLTRNEVAEARMEARHQARLAEEKALWERMGERERRLSAARTRILEENLTLK